MLCTCAIDHPLGTLFTIDTEEASVTLESVKCFGTEDRVTGANAVQALDDIYEHIIFAGKDIKDLTVILDYFLWQRLWF